MKNPLKIVAIVLSALLLLAGSSEAKHPRQKVKSSSPPPGAPADSEPAAKTVQYGERDVVKLKAKVGFTTLIVLPEKEVVLDYVCGDKEFWIVNGYQNVAYVKPAKEGSMTNLNLVTEAGNIYTFVLAEISKNPESQPDLKVFVEPKEKSMIIAIDQAPRIVSSREIDDYRQQLVLAKEETLHTKETDQAEKDAQIGKLLSEFRFSYHFDRDKKPFQVSEIWHDSRFTYIKAAPDEIPTLYEIRDGKPNLVNFEYKNGVYIAEKVIDRGYLMIGKSRLLFVRHEEL